MNYKLSVVLPTFNRASRLQKSLENYLLCAKNDEILFIIVDNASEDNTKEVVDSFMKEYSNIKYIKNLINIGLSRNIYRGFLEVETEYFMILADDDFITDGFFNLILNSTEKYPTAGVINHVPKNEDINGIYRQNPMLKETTLLNKGAKSFKITISASGAIPGIVYKTNLINQDLWLLDNTIYPQIRLSCEIAINHNILYLVSDESTLIPENDTIMDITKTRPLDYGIFERLEILFNVSKKLPKEDQQETLNAQSLNLFRWGSAVFKLMYIEDEKYAFRYLNKLLEHSFIRSSLLFWVSFLKVILYSNEIKESDKTKLLLKLFISIPTSIFNKNLYMSILYMIRK